jgi:hypothetical protein
MPYLNLNNNRLLAVMIFTGVNFPGYVLYFDPRFNRILRSKWVTVKFRLILPVFLLI